MATLEQRIRAAVKLWDIVNDLRELVARTDSHVGVYNALTVDEKAAMVSVLTTSEKNELVAWFNLAKTFNTNAAATVPTFLVTSAAPEV